MLRDYQRHRDTTTPEDKKLSFLLFPFFYLFFFLIFDLFSLIFYLLFLSPFSFLFSFLILLSFIFVLYYMRCTRTGRFPPLARRING